MADNRMRALEEVDTNTEAGVLEFIQWRGDKAQDKIMVTILKIGMRAVHS